MLHSNESYIRLVKIQFNNLHSSLTQIICHMRFVKTPNTEEEYFHFRCSRAFSRDILCVTDHRLYKDLKPTLL